jgi:predicted DNA binding CopG/RHH family protein
MAEMEIAMPRFGSEREEADWWAENPEYVLQELKRAKAEGRLGHGTVARRMDEVKAAKAKSTTIRLDPSDISLAKLQAAKRGLKYQTYLKMLIHEALGREAR